MCHHNWHLHSFKCQKCVVHRCVRTHATMGTCCACRMQAAAGPPAVATTDLPVLSAQFLLLVSARASECQAIGVCEASCLQSSLQHTPVHHGANYGWLGLPCSTAHCLACPTCACTRFSNCPMRVSVSADLLVKVCSKVDWCMALQLLEQQLLNFVPAKQAGCPARQQPAYLDSGTASLASKNNQRSHCCLTTAKPNLPTCKCCLSGSPQLIHQQSPTGCLGSCITHL